MSVKNVSETVKTSNADVFEDFTVITAGLDDSLEFMGGDGWEIKREILIFEFGIRIDFSVSVGEIECNGVWHIGGIKV